LQSKFNLTPIDGKLWKMLRLRPTNFPYIRLAQFAALIHQSSKLFSKIIENPNLKELQKLFNCEPSSYWGSHYQFGEICPMKSKKLGKAAIDILLIIQLFPFCFATAKANKTKHCKMRRLIYLKNNRQKKITLPKIGNG
jgi:hypothetical protein